MIKVSMTDWIKPGDSLEVACALAYFALAFMLYFFSQESKWTGRLAKRLGDRPSQPEIQIYIENLVKILREL